MTDSSLVLLGKRVILWWGLATLAVLAGIGTGYVPEAHIGALVGVYSTFTVAACGLAAALLGLDAAGERIIPALKGGSK